MDLNDVYLSRPGLFRGIADLGELWMISGKVLWFPPALPMYSSTTRSIMSRGIIPGAP
jgi:hypothetical protein